MQGNPANPTVGQSITTYTVVSHDDRMVLADGAEYPPSVFMLMPGRDERDVPADAAAWPADCSTPRNGPRHLLLGFREGVAESGVQWHAGMVDLSATLIKHNPIFHLWVRFEYGNETGNLLIEKNWKETKGLGLSSKTAGDEFIAATTGGDCSDGASSEALRFAQETESVSDGVFSGI